MTRLSALSAAVPNLKSSWQPTQAFQANPAAPCPAPTTQPAAVPDLVKKVDVPVPVPAAAGLFKKIVQHPFSL
jgi:hypothetical protein